MKRYLRFLLVALAIVLSSGFALAESQAQKFYNQGKKFQNTMTVASQDKAIAQFQKAYNFFDSSEMKQRCLDEIKHCEQLKVLIVKPKPNPNTPGSTPKDDGPVVKKATLDLGNKSFEVSSESRTIPVSVKTNQEDWDASVVTGSDGSSFLKVSKAGDDEIQISVSQNVSTAARAQKIKVTAGNAVEYITVTQTGVPVRIEVSEPVVKFKAKGGSKEMYVLCNSSEKYVENFGENWYIEMCPSWVDITIGSLGKDESKVKEMAGKAFDGVKGWFGKKSKDDSAVDPDMVVTPITVTVQNVDTDEQAYRQGRTFKVRLRSGTATVEFLVQQERKK